MVEEGDPRGEFIALQLVSVPDAKQRARIAELLKWHRKAWLGELASSLDPSSTFERGFLSRAKLHPWHEIPADATTDRAWRTVRTIDLEGDNRRAAVERGFALLNAPSNALEEVIGIPHSVMNRLLAGEGSCRARTVSGEIVVSPAGETFGGPTSHAPRAPLPLRRAIPRLTRLRLTAWGLTYVDEFRPFLAGLPADLERFAVATHLTAELGEWMEALEVVPFEAVEIGTPDRRVAFTLHRAGRTDAFDALTLTLHAPRRRRVHGDALRSFSLRIEGGGHLGESYEKTLHEALRRFPRLVRRRIVPAAMTAAHLKFVAGTIEARDVDPALLPASFVKDERAGCHRAPALAYAETMRALHRAKVEVIDEARAYEELTTGARVHREPRPYQAIALEAWKASRGRGVVVLPTGAGKSHVATMAIDEKRRSTLVVAPTLDLVRQWFDLLRTTFGGEIGVVGGGEHVVRPLTVTTYDSAYLHMEHFGARFGMVVFDECHHLPGASHAFAARACLAPYRLGLTATPERPDGRDADLDVLVGPIVHRSDVTELRGVFLAEYETETIAVDLSPEERAEYDAERAIYREFVRAQGIRLGSPSGWSDFIIQSSRSDEGRRAMAAWRRQRELAHRAASKLEFVEHLLHVHRRDRTILFTQDNATAYDVSRRFLVPAITHQTKVRERSAILAGLAEGTYAAVATSKVLNEGVDVPDANVAIVISGSGSVREHVQRLGRVLRKRGDKRAVLYELVTGGTGETFVSERRREHVAYR